MGSNIQCFFLEPMAFARESLRRFTFSDRAACPANSWGHDASVIIGNVPYPPADRMGEGGDTVSHDDPNWPKKCAQCDYLFKPEDQWQRNLNRLMHRGDHGAMWTTLAEAPVGSMWYADWYPWRGPDGHCLVVKTPGGEWIVDGPSSGGGTPWTRTGEVPRVTANPSIHFPGKYHGWLREGVLVEC